MQISIFPQFTRKFAAGGLTHTLTMSMWVFLLGIFGYNSYLTVTSTSQLQQYVRAVHKHIYDPEAHTQLAGYLWHIGQKTNARNEIASIQHIRLATNADILGITTTPETLLSEWNHEEAVNQKNYNYWENITKQYPNYLDGFIQAGVAALQLHNINEAKTYFEKAHFLNPQSEIVQKALFYLDKD